jgi:hypothetical protein
MNIIRPYLPTTYLRLKIKRCAMFLIILQTRRNLEKHLFKIGQYSHELLDEESGV